MNCFGTYRHRHIRHARHADLTRTTRTEQVGYGGCGKALAPQHARSAAGSAGFVAGVASARPNKMNLIVAMIMLVIALPCTAIPVWSYAQENAAHSQEISDAIDASGTAEKIEVVYSTLDATGSPQDMYVVNVVEGSEGEVVQDFGSYEQVTNVTDTSQISQLSDSVVFTIPEDENKFTYQGILSEAVLPWNISLSYYLDGEEVSAKDLAGATGTLTLHLETSENTEVDSRFYENYLIQATVTLPTDVASNVQTDDGSIALSGSDIVVTFMVMPDSDGSVSLSADVQNFAMDGISFAAVPFSMAIDFPDTDSLMAGFDDLIVGVDELNAGAQDLASGITSIDSAVQQVASGALSVESGANQLMQGLQQYQQGLMSSAKETQTSIDEDALGEAQEEYQDALQDYLISVIAEYQDIMATAPTTDVQGALTQAFAQADQSDLKTALENLIKVASAQAGKTAAAEALMQAAEGLGSVQDSSTILGGASSLSAGTEQLASALDQLAGGTGQLASGAGDLADGTLTLAQETQGIPDEISVEIESIMSAYDTSDFEPVSYVSSKNTNVSLVQFVLTTDAISAPETEEPEEEEEEQTVLDRFVALFS